MRLFSWIAPVMALLVFWSFDVQAQLSQPIPPKSVTHNLPGATTVEMPAIDRVAIDREDAFEDQFTQPRRVAYPFPTNYSMKDGTWTDLPGGDRVWQFRVIANGAQAISLLYEDFFIPAGATMHVFNPKTGETIGAFTAANNKTTRKFATALTYGDQAVIEVYEPAAQRGQTSMTISQVGHAYRLVEVLNAAELAQRPSGSCQVNINCSEGNNWQNQKKSVARILMNGSGLCTGSLLNNTAQDGKPYFLTADHCIGSLDALGNNSASGYVFYWNYERATCDNTSATNSSETTTGATLRANDNESDFALFELTEDPNSLYDVYFNGFSANATPAVGGVGIHHPAGDYKKISTHSIAPLSSTINGNPANSYWRINWDATTNGHSVTEGGSSGSPLYESTGVVIGQLYGGSSINCSNPANDPGVYGKIAYSWNNNGATLAARRLRDWLDPVGAGSTLYQAGAYVNSTAPINVDFVGVSGTVNVYEASATTPFDCREYTDLTLTVAASGTLSSPVTISTSSFGTADNSADYILSPSSVTLSPTVSTADFTLRVFNDDAVEVQEDLIIDLLSSSATVTTGTNSSLTVNFIDDDSAIGSSTPITFMHETFDTGIPNSWQIMNGGTTTDTWEAVATRSGSSLNGTNFAIVDADAAGSGATMDETLLTPVYDVSNASSLQLSFDQYFRVNASGTVGTLEYMESTFFSGFSSFGLTIDPNAPLPVELLSFSGSYIPNQGNRIDWKTATEWENDFFELQHSEDGLSFRQNSIQAAGDNPLEVQNYSQLDAKPIASTTYYRLRQVDLDGTETFSDVIAVSSAKGDFEALTARPLTTSSIEVQLASDVAEIRLINTNGQLTQVWNQQVAGSTILNTDATLASGLYVVETIRQDGQAQRVKILVP